MSDLETPQAAEASPAPARRKSRLPLLLRAIIFVTTAAITIYALISLSQWALAQLNNAVESLEGNWIQQVSVRAEWTTYLLLAWFVPAILVFSYIFKSPIWSAFWEKESATDA